MSDVDVHFYSNAIREEAFGHIGFAAPVSKLRLVSDLARLESMTPEERAERKESLDRLFESITDKMLVAAGSGRGIG